MGPLAEGLLSLSGWAALALLFALPALEAPAFLGLVLPGGAGLAAGRRAGPPGPRPGPGSYLRQAREWAWAANRYAVWALGSSGIAVLAAAAALVTR
jgi:hypothetical protein